MCGLEPCITKWVLCWSICSCYIKNSVNAYYETVHSRTLRKRQQFLPVQCETKVKKIVITFSAYELPVAMAVDVFVENWFATCSSLAFLPKIMLVSADEVGVRNPKIVEIDPIQFFKGKCNS